ncbi:O-antigen polymerase [Streptococcus sp. zg-JUN1979]|uniref:O-antigen polymerase n=1 Tax=Streptococcus sp. zg-JUN1979 TaxID=3391450 RepID=UPI0039A6B9A8
MITLLLCVCLIIFLLSFFIEPIKLNPLTIFFGEWTIIIFLVSLKLYGILPVSDKFFQMILIGSVMFFLGFYLFKVFNNIAMTRIGTVNRPNYEYVINDRVVKFLIIVSLIFFSIDFFKSLIYFVQGYSLNHIRQVAQSGALFSNPVMNAIRIIIAAPFSLALTPLVAANFFSKRRNNFYILGTLLILLMRLFSDGGRSPIIYLILCMFISYVFHNFNGKRSKLTFKRVIVIKSQQLFIIAFLIASCIGIYLITKSRSGEDTIRDTYYYFAMEPYMFQKWANIVDSKNMMAFGMATFNGFLFPLSYLLANIVPGVGYFTAWRNVYEVIEGLGTQWQVITSYGTSANSYVSIFWTFYFDGRLLGIIIGMFCYGIFMAYFYFKVLKNRSEKNIALYSMVLIGLFYSFQQMIFQNIYWSLGFLMLLTILYKKERRK